uniref:Uncharacterized protein n=1 Tax=Aegilops tauschii TaxID=37682 RepID=N1QWQ0_AEGTA
MKFLDGCLRLRRWWCFNWRLRLRGWVRGRKQAAQSSACSCPSWKAVTKQPSQAEELVSPRQSARAKMTFGTLPTVSVAKRVVLDAAFFGRVDERSLSGERHKEQEEGEDDRGHPRMTRQTHG